MTKKNISRWIWVVLLWSMMFQAWAQQGDFKPSGKPIARVFADYAYQKQNDKAHTGFFLRRGMLGYDYSFTERLSARMLLDVTTKSSRSDYTAHLRDAYLKYKHPLFTLNIGQTATALFNLQEVVWGKRYLQKSLQDLYGFGSGTDLGILFTATPSPAISVDLGIFNGEGFRSVETDSVLKTSLGVTIKASNRLIYRVYAEYLPNNRNITPTEKPQTTFNTFVSYTAERVKLSAEWNYQKNHRRQAEYDVYGISVYGDMLASEKINVFARWDKVFSKNRINASGETLGRDDGVFYILGAEYLWMKGIRVSPNIQVFAPEKDDSKVQFCFFANLELSF